MFVHFFLALRAAGLTPGGGALLTRIEALRASHARASLTPWLNLHCQPRKRGNTVAAMLTQRVELGRSFWGDL